MPGRALSCPTAALMSNSTRAGRTGRLLLLLLILSLSCNVGTPFSIQPQHRQLRLHPLHKKGAVLAPRRQPSAAATTTALHVILDVPDGFFTVTFAGLGLCLSLAKNFARIRMEENAWEQRLAEARRERLRQDPTLTELDVRRQEAAMEWSAYGQPAAQERQRREAEEAEEDEFRGRRGRRMRVQTMNREDYDDDDEWEEASTRRRSRNRMTDEEIDAFELEYGIDYDPYYDDPYTEDELPSDSNYQQDKFYGDRTYETGEVFFKDKATGLYYRQGAKPRNLRFFS